MKRQTYLTVLMVAVLTLPIGCEKPQEQVGPSVPNSTFTLMATIEQPGESESNPSTKTSLGSTNETKWSNGDQINVFSGSLLDKTTVMSTESTGTTATFIKVSGDDPVTSSNYYGFYPYTVTTNPSINPTTKLITATLGDQTYVANSFGVNAAPMVAHPTNGSSMAFKNVYGLLKINLMGASDVQVSSIRVTSNAGEYLSGEATIDYNGGTPTVEFTNSNPGKRSTSVTLNCTSVQLSNTSTSFYIALPPTKAAATIYGYKVEIFTTDGRKMTKTMSGALAENLKIERSKIRSMAPITFVAEPSMANSYIVAPNNTTGFTFNASYKGNSSDYVNTIRPKSAKLLWNTGNSSSNVITDVTLANGFVSFKTANVGNAVIAVFDEDGTTILWSWHIWVTDYNPNTTYVTYPNSLPTANAIMMDRNLGALSARNDLTNTDDFGLLYQWGRKDPFRGADNRTTGTTSFAPTSVTTGYSWGTKLVQEIIVSPVVNALDYAIKHPMTFIIKDASLYGDWYCTDIYKKNNFLWSSTKSIYDPCPAGWRVPYCNSFGGTWAGIYSGLFYNSGVMLNSPSTWYPTAGRINANGSIELVGYQGYQWSCSADDAYSFATYFGSLGEVNTSSNERNCGMSVRCQKE